MGYIIVCQAPSNRGKTTTIKSFCSELEAMPSSNFEVLYQDGAEDIIRAYRRFGLLIYVISAGDDESLVKSGYSKLQYACGGLNCDILICAATKNKERQHVKHKKIEAVISAIAKQNGHYIKRIILKKFYDPSDTINSNKEQLNALRKEFVCANDRLTKNGTINFS